MAAALKNSSNPIIVVGAGLAGLSAALEIESHGESCLVLEASDRIGGKLETSVVEDNYLLDRGFQVILPSYPEIKRLGDLSALDLQYFSAGAKLETPEGSVLMADPFRHPEALFSTAFGSYATIKDKWLVGRLQQTLRWKSEDQVLGTSQTTLEFLRAYGFSDLMISNFWRPFFSGIFLESDLATSAGFFKYLVKMFSSSRVAVPRKGVGELPKLMAQCLKKSEIRFQAKVHSVEGRKVRLEDGSALDGKAVIQATQGATGPDAKGPFGVVTTLWFQAPEAPFAGPWLSLNSHLKKQKINHVAVLSNVSRDYAPKGDALISVNIVARLEQNDLAKVLAEAESLFGRSVTTWRLLRTDVIERAFPLYLNRSDADTPSQQGALLRGRDAAQTALRASLNG